MNITSEGQFRGTMEMAVALWKKRAKLLPELDVTSGWEDVLEELEEKYRAFVDSLAPVVPTYAHELAPYLTKKDGPGLEVALHLMLMSRTPVQWERILAIASNEPTKQYWAVAEVLRFCPEDVFLPVAESLLALRHHWLAQAVADPVARRAHSRFVPQLERAVVDPRDGGADPYVVKALGFLGEAVSIATLKALLERESSAGATPRATVLARALYMLKDEAGPAFYRREIERELSHMPDMTWWYATFGARTDLEFLLKRAQTTRFPGWKVEAVRSLGMLGLPDAMPYLLDQLSPTDLDLRRAADQALTRLTGASMTEVDVEDNGPSTQDAWRSWWRTHEVEFAVGARYRDGKLFWLDEPLGWMNHPLWDERDRPHVNMLVYTGAYLPFDPRGYLRDQRTAFTAWETHVARLRVDLPPGEFWRWGKVLA